MKAQKKDRTANELSKMWSDGDIKHLICFVDF